MINANSVYCMYKCIFLRSYHSVALQLSAFEGLNTKGLQEELDKYQRNRDRKLIASSNRSNVI